MKSSTVKLTKIRQFYFPVDADDYKLLRERGLPAIRIHENLLPTFGLIFKKYNIKPQHVSFNDAILNPYLDKIGETWQSKPHRKASITKSVMKFETLHSSIQLQSREALHKLESSLRRFFQRWGSLHHSSSRSHAASSSSTSTTDSILSVVPSSRSWKTRPACLRSRSTWGLYG